MTKILLNPGPTNTRFFTKIAQWKGTDVCHRTNDFLAVLRDTKRLLLRRFSIDAHRADWNVSILAGSGTTALEAMISSLISGKQSRVINAGAYGQRAVEIMNTYKIKHSEIGSASICDIEDSDFAGNLYFVENETSTGERYSVQEVCKKYPNARLYVDATAAFGASNYDTVLDNIGAISFCANKCLQSPPGLGLVIWKRAHKSFSRTHSLDLSRYIDGALPFTLPTQSVYALRETLSTNERDWLFRPAETEKAFNRRRKQLLVEMEKLGIRAISKTPANSIIAFTHPSMNYEELRGFLRTRGIIIYSGIPGIEGSFRISTMSTLFDKKFKKIINTFRKSIR